MEPEDGAQGIRDLAQSRFGPHGGQDQRHQIGLAAGRALQGIEGRTDRLRIAALAQSLPASRWYRRKVSEGTKGPIEYECARTRVTLWKDGLPDRTVWLIIKRTLGAEPSYFYYISHAPASAPLRLFVR